MVYPGSWSLGPSRIPTPCSFTRSGPTDANSAGFVHGGVIMKLCDEVAAIAGVRHSRRPRRHGGDGPHDLQRAGSRSASC